MKERQTCLANFQKDADIPMEVLAALPSASEILEKAQAASMRAQEALANNRDKETNES